jgi:hypothetical protein
MNPKRLDNLTSYSVNRTERIHRFLKDHSDIMATYSASLTAVRIKRHKVQLSRITIMIAGSEKDFPLHDPTGGRHDSQYGLSYDTLSASGLSDNAQRLSGFQTKSHTIHRPYGALVQYKVNSKVFNLQDRKHPVYLE